MAISPQKARDNMTEQEITDMALIEKHIDDVLKSSYMGEGLTIPFPKNVECTKRMAVRLENLYKASGWATCDFSLNSKTITFSEYPNTGCVFDR